MSGPIDTQGPSNAQGPDNTKGPATTRGYLGHMADLAFNRVALVQPRLASRFEGSVGEAPVEDYREAVARPGMPLAAAAPETDAPGHQRTPLPEADRVQRPEPHSPQAVELPASAIVRSPEREQPFAPSAPARVEKRTEIQELIREQVRERPLLVPMPVSLPAAIVEPGKPVAEGGLTIENIQHFHNEPAAQRTEPARTISAPVAQPTPVTYRPLQVQARMSAPESQRDTLAPRAAETARMATPAPSIQVSIGRIEIKANPASASPAAKPKAAPTTLSLDDYLKQRKGDR